jgi:hypothetical protein
MNVHKNARLTPLSRADLVRRVLELPLPTIRARIECISLVDFGSTVTNRWRIAEALGSIDVVLTGDDPSAIETAVPKGAAVG